MALGLPQKSWDDLMGQNKPKNVDVSAKTVL
jgi:hypothetical protein